MARLASDPLEQSVESAAMSASDQTTVFRVPRLNQHSVTSGGCCPVPAEAVLLPELELLPGVREASADWQSAEIRVRHAVGVEPADLAGLLAELRYPAAGWRTGDA